MTDIVAENVTEDGSPDGETGAAESGPNREAAKYRTQLRAAEKERDALADRINAMQRREIERVAGESLASPGDLFAFGADISELLDDSGDVSVEKVGAAVSALLDTRPGLAVLPPPPSFEGGARQSIESKEPTFGEFLSRSLR